MMIICLIFLEMISLFRAAFRTHLSAMCCLRRLERISARSRKINSADVFTCLQCYRDGARTPCGYEKRPS